MTPGTIGVGIGTGMIWPEPLSCPNDEVFPCKSACHKKSVEGSWPVLFGKRASRQIGLSIETPWCCIRPHVYTQADQIAHA
jgi:hypothetical protein